MVATICILGAGPSGLTLARLLEIHQIDYAIYERNESADAIGQGGSLDIHKNSGQLALKEAGLIEAFNACARYDGQRAEIVDKNRNPVWLRENEGQDDKPEIDRKDLRQLLLDSIPPERIHWGHKVESVERSSNGIISVKFDNGEIESGFKLLVGADGAWSKVRQLACITSALSNMLLANIDQITPATPMYSGFHYLQTSVLPSSPCYQTMASLVRRGTYVALGSGQQMAAQYTGDGSYNVYLGLPLPEHWSQDRSSSRNDAELRVSLLANEFKDWAPELKDWIRHSEGPIYSWPLYAMPVESLCWGPTSDVTLVGDAAHVSTPFVGEGVNYSMHDSLQLAQAIVECGPGRLDEAVARYEKAMFPRAIDLITRSAASGELLFAEDAPERFRAMIAELAAA